MSELDEIILAYEEVEAKILSNLKRTFEKYIQNHNISEMDDIGWGRFEAEAIKGLKEFKIENKKVFLEYRSKISKMSKDYFETLYLEEQKTINDELTKMANKGFINMVDVEMGKIDTRGMKTLLNDYATKQGQLQEIALLRVPADKYKKIILSSHIYRQTGESLWECVDMATSKFCQNGITTIQYANGANVNISSYSEMAIRTTGIRVRNQSDSDMRDEWGVPPLVICSSYGACSPKCLPWQGRIYYDDVYSTQENKGYEDIQYTRLSEAIDGGLFHPNCRHNISTYIEGMDLPRQVDRPATEIEDIYKQEQKQRSIERELRKTKRLKESCLTEEEKTKYNKKINSLNKKMKNHIETTNEKYGKEVLRRDRSREVNRPKK